MFVFNVGNIPQWDYLLHGINIPSTTVVDTLKLDTKIFNHITLNGGPLSNPNLFIKNINEKYNNIIVT